MTKKQQTVMFTLLIISKVHSNTASKIWGTLFVMWPYKCDHNKPVNNCHNHNGPFDDYFIPKTDTLILLLVLLIFRTILSITVNITSSHICYNFCPTQLKNRNIKDLIFWLVKLKTYIKPIYNDCHGAENFRFTGRCNIALIIEQNSIE